MELERTARARSRPLGVVYEDTRQRVVSLVGRLDAAAAARAVPACPQWRVHDVVAHVTGVCADILAGNLRDVASEPWTAAQVRARAGRPMADVLGEWHEVGPKVAALVDLFPGRYGLQLVSDVTVHEQDLRGALERPGARDSDAVEIGTDFLVAAIFAPALLALGLGPLEVCTDGARWIAGTGGPPAAGDADWRDALLCTTAAPVPATPPVGRLVSDRFELFRALTGRRSATQIRRFGWTVDPEPYLPAFGFGPFTLRSDELDE